MKDNIEKINILIIDNFDSFTYNLLHEFTRFGHNVKVIRNNISIEDFDILFRKFKPKLLVLSPGPGSPTDSGITLEVINRYHKEIAIFGVCLGHQSLAHAFGGKVERLNEIVHGKQSYITHSSKSIFEGLDNPLRVGRYHSLGITRLPDCFDVIAAKDDIIMAIKHKNYPIWGVQFHPESILSPSGIHIIHNILSEISGEKDNNMTSILKDLISKQEISGDMLKKAFRFIMDGRATTAQIGAFLMGVSSLKLDADILYTCASVMKEKAYPVSTTRKDIVDTCGTGGDSTGSFNISTTVAFVLAGLGVSVAKHGNRSVSSKSGSSDVLIELGLDINRTPEKAVECLDKVGVTFLAAPVFHSSMRFVAGARKEMGIRTIFNLLGPLSNPLNVDYQLIGVYDEAIAPIYRDTLIKLGIKAGAVVCGFPLDEVSTIGETKIYAFNDNEKKDFTINPEDFGLKRVNIEDIKGDDASVNAVIVRNILKNESTEAQKDIVLLNSAVILFIMGKAKSIEEGIKLSKESIESGSAYKKLEEFLSFK